MNDIKNRFIKAYIWMFSASKKRAHEIYNDADQEYIIAVIETYENHANKVFYFD